MALFKVFRGQRNDLKDVDTVDGHAYFCIDDGSFHIDYKDSDGFVKRKELNANNAKMLTGKTLEKIEKEFQDSLTITGTVTKAVGGILENTTYDKANIIDVLEELLFYVPFTFSSISTFDPAGTKEYGTIVTVTKVTPKFTAGSDDIKSVKIGTTSGGNELFSGKLTSNNEITLTSPVEYNGSTGGTIYCTLSDGKTTTTKSASVSYAYYDYSKLSSSLTPDTTGATKQTTSGADNTYSYDAGQYLWLYSRSSGKKIQTYVAGSWADVTTTQANSTVELTLASGATATYYAYRTDKFAGAGSARYRLA